MVQVSKDKKSSRREADFTFKIRTVSGIKLGLTLLKSYLSRKKQKPKTATQTAN